MQSKIFLIIFLVGFFLLGCVGVKYQVESVDVITHEKTLRASGCASACADVMGGEWCKYFSNIAIQQCEEHRNKTQYIKQLELIKRFHKQAEANDPEAQKKLGYLYYEGIGVNKDYGEALKWYKRSANQGNASAQYALGVMYLNGQGVTHNYEKGIEWIQKSANNGHQEAIKTLRVLHYYENKYERKF